MSDLLAIGHCVLDHLLVVERHPGPDSKSVALGGVECGGGPAATAAVAAAKLGSSAAFLGRCGDDAAGRRLREEFEAAGVDVGRLEAVAGARTPRASIWVEASSGRRSVVLDRGGLADQGEERLADFDPAAFRLLLSDGKEPLALPASKAVRAAGGEVLLDLGGPRREPAELIAAATVVGASKAFVMDWLPDADLLEATRTIVGLGPRLAVVTLGPGGVVACDGGEPFWFPAWTPPKVVDSTGAGDAWHGALAWALLQGWETRRCLAAAAVAGGLACRALGGRAGLPERAELLAALESASWPGGEW